jgi:ABC-type Zn uptake system ZnuABC Zn-binding protein ZnuA
MFAIAPLLLPHVFALPSPNPDLLSDIKEGANDVMDKVVNRLPITNTDDPPAATDASSRLIQNATQIAKGLKSLLDGKVDLDDLTGITQLASIGGQGFDNIKNVAKEIKDALPGLPKIAKEAEEKLQKAMKEVKKIFDEIKSDLENPEKLLKDAGPALEKIRGVASKIASVL